MVISPGEMGNSCEGRIEALCCVGLGEEDVMKEKRRREREEEWEGKRKWNVKWKCNIQVIILYFRA
jgi:hypothetical protein